MLGFLMQWPTLLTLLIIPVLVVMYVRLGRIEEREALQEFGDRAYMRKRRFDRKRAVGKAAGGAYQRTREIGRLAFASLSREVSVDRRRFSNRRLFGFRNDSQLSPLSLAPYSVADDRPRE